MDSNHSAIEQDISSTFARILKYKWVVIIGTLLSAVLSVFIAINQPNLYTAKSYLVPTNSNEGGGLSKLAGQFGGLASVAGISLGGNDGNDIDAALEFMKSRGFLHTFIEKRALLPEILALELWDQQTNTYIYDLEQYNPETKTWVRKAQPGKSVIPTPWEGYIALTKSIDALYMKKKGLVEIKVTTVSPELSVKILQWLIEDVNEFWRKKDKDEAEEAINYLKDRASETSIAELQTVFYELIAEQTRSKLLSSIGDYHLLKPLSPIILPEEKSGPSRAIICLGITLLGGLFSLVITFVLALSSRAKGQ
ncbi:LPS O-antigen length regulator [Pseudoalteromonas sp. JBTF-M23]|uniref:LPS O-antigen length regulator n=1 Tax=Pseudoalteromonas caenipelagi TaxID=2726988 RepID=A0A849VEU2_9GAMM|nr:LPS O-antigen length regulator [Pseudoalteromonas caenipelagi]NOU51796.1 LPS O-antigen length regulator [Pseudoalteromonas caenipelagi]